MFLDKVIFFYTIDSFHVLSGMNYAFGAPALR